MLDPERTDALKCPLLIVVGEHDLALVYDASQRWHQRVSESELVMLPGAGHCANLDEPTAFRMAWLRFVDRVDGDGAGTS